MLRPDPASFAFGLKVGVGRFNSMHKPRLIDTDGAYGTKWPATCTGLLHSPPYCPGRLALLFNAANAARAMLKEELIVIDIYEVLPGFGPQVLAIIQ